MRSRIGKAFIGVGAAAAVVVATGPSSTAHAATPDRGARAFPHATATVSPTIAVRGKDNKLYSLRGSDTKFRNLGGSLSAAPAIAYSSSSKLTYYVVRGSDDALYVRTDTQPFTKLVSSKCAYQPAVYISGTTFIVACIGASNHALYYGRATIAGSKYVSVPAMIYQGGKSDHGPSITYEGGTPQFTIVDTRDPAKTGNVSVRAATDPVGKFSTVNEYCADQIDVVEDSNSDAFYFGCLSGNVKQNGGTTKSLYIETAKGESAIGAIAGRPGIAPAPDFSSALVFVTGTDGAVYLELATADDDSDFGKIGGSAQPGVAATTVG